MRGLSTFPLIGHSEEVRNLRSLTAERLITLSFWRANFARKNLLFNRRG